jgi:transposase
VANGTRTPAAVTIAPITSMAYELVAGFPRLAAIVAPLLSVRQVIRQQSAVLHKMLLEMVRDDPVCRRLMTAQGSAPWSR